MSVDCVRRLGLAKSRIDNGFSQLGRDLRAGELAAEALMLCAARAVALGNATMILAGRDHATEALPLLRSLFDLAVWARWIAHADGEIRAAEFFKTRRCADWSSAWDRKECGEKAERLSFPVPLRKAAEDYPRHLFSNAGGLPWSHLFAGSKAPAVSQEDLLGPAAALMGQVLKALEQKWPEHFHGSDEISGNIQ